MSMPGIHQHTVCILGKGALPELARWSCLATSSTNIIAGDARGRIWIWERFTFLHRTLPNVLTAGEGDACSAVAFIDDDIAASAHASGVIRLWDRNQGACLGSLDCPASVTHLLAIDGMLVAAAGGMLKAWQVQDRSPAWTAACAGPAGLAVHQGCILAGDGRRLSLVGLDGAILGSSEMPEPFTVLARGGTGRQTAVVQTDGCVRTLQLPSKNRGGLPTLIDLSPPIAPAAIALAMRGKQCLAWCAAGTVAVWNRGTQKVRRTELHVPLISGGCDTDLGIVSLPVEGLPFVDGQHVPDTEMPGGRILGIGTDLFVEGRTSVHRLNAEGHHIAKIQIPRGHIEHLVAGPSGFRFAVAEGDELDIAELTNQMAADLTAAGEDLGPDDPRRRVTPAVAARGHRITTYVCPEDLRSCTETGSWPTSSTPHEAVLLDGSVIWLAERTLWHVHDGQARRIPDVTGIEAIVGCTWGAAAIDRAGAITLVDARGQVTQRHPALGLDRPGNLHGAADAPCMVHFDSLGGARTLLPDGGIVAWRLGPWTGHYRCTPACIGRDGLVVYGSHVLLRFSLPDGRMTAAVPCPEDDVRPCSLLPGRIIMSSRYQFWTLRTDDLPALPAAIAARLQGDERSTGPAAEITAALLANDPALFAKVIAAHPEPRGEVAMAVALGYGLPWPCAGAALKRQVKQAMQQALRVADASQTVALRWYAPDLPAAAKPRR